MLDPSAKSDKGIQALNDVLLCCPNKNNEEVMNQYQKMKNGVYEPYNESGSINYDAIFVLGNNHEGE